ncbi:MAG: hypothetical protein V4532_15605 [Pseudomonadota bacterium]
MTDPVNVTGAIPLQPALTHIETDAEEQAQREAITRRIEHLFRYSVRAGHIHPLMHLVMAFQTGAKS